MAAMTGYNATLQLDNAAGTPTTIGSVRMITPLSASVGTVETTTLTSTSGFREYIATLSDLGEASVTILYDPLDAADVIIRAAVVDRVIRTFKLTYPDASYQQAEVIVTAWTPAQIQPDGLMELTFTCKGTGVPAYA
jgi:predicted secreted protein